MDVFVQTSVKNSPNSWGKCSPRSRRSSRRRTDERMANVLVQTVSKPQKKNEMVIQGKKKKKKGKKSEELERCMCVLSMLSETGKERMR